MNDYNKDFNEIMDLLKTVPGVTEHLNSPQVKLGKEVFKRLMDIEDWKTYAEYQRAIDRDDWRDAVSIIKLENTGETND